jgi:hypothetical protein
MVLGFQGFKSLLYFYLSRVFMVPHQLTGQSNRLYTKVLLLPAPALGGMDLVPED